MQLSRNVMIDKLLELVNSNKHVIRVSLSGGMPPKTVNYHLEDGTIEKLDLEMTYDEYKAEAEKMRVWCDMLKKLEIVG